MERRIGEHGELDTAQSAQLAKPASATPSVLPASVRLTARLLRLRGTLRLDRFDAVWMGGLPGCFAGYVVISYSVAFLMAGLSWLGPFDLLPDDSLLVPLMELLLALACFFAGMVFAERYSATLLQRYYQRTWTELWTTSLMPLVLQEDVLRQLLAQAEQTFMLRWISPPPPRTLEHQLEIAACYMDALRRWQHGTARMESGSLWHGAYAWITAQRQGRSCGCLAALLLGWLGIVLAVLAFFVSCQRRGALAALCDFLLYSDAQQMDAASQVPTSGAG